MYFKQPIFIFGIFYIFIVFLHKVPPRGTYVCIYVSMYLISINIYIKSTKKIRKITETQHKVSFQNIKKCNKTNVKSTLLRL